MAAVQVPLLAILLALCLPHISADLQEAGDGCMKGWAGASGRAGRGESESCKASRRSTPYLQSGEVVVPSSRVSPLRTVTHSFPRAFKGAHPRILATISGTARNARNAADGSWLPAACNCTFAVTIRETGRAFFSVNVYRVDAAPEGGTDGWPAPLLLRYIAWDGDEEGDAGAEAGQMFPPAGVQFGTFSAPQVYPPPRNAPWMSQPLFTGASPAALASEGERTPPTVDSIPEDDAGGMAAYQGGQPELFHIRFTRVFSHAPRVLATVRVPSLWDKQAVLSHTVRAVYPHGFDLSVHRVDQSWPLRDVEINYLAWLPSLEVPTERSMVGLDEASYSGSGSVTGDPLTDLPPPEAGACLSPPCIGRSAGRILDPYVLPRAQFGTHTIAPPVPTSAGTGRFVPPDIRWAAEQSRAGATGSLGERGIRLPSSVEYWLPFTFPGVHPNETVFNFTPPPFVIATPRIHSDLVPEHGNQVSDTFAVSVIEVTSAGFMVRVFRTDRSGETWPDRGGRGWSKTLDIDWIAWEPSVADFTVLQAGVPRASEVKENEYVFFRINVLDPGTDLLVFVNDSSAGLLDWDDALGGGAIRKAWLPGHVTPFAGPASNVVFPNQPLNRVVRLHSTARPDDYAVPNVLALLNQGLIPESFCLASSSWRPDGNSSSSSPFFEAGECSQEDGRAARPWPYAEALLYSPLDQQWYRLECSGAGCPHRLPMRVAPLRVVVSSEVPFPTADLLAKTLPPPTSGGLWAADDLSGEMRVHAFAAPGGFPAGRAYIGVGGRAASNFTITVQVGSLAPINPTANGSTNAEVVPYKGRILFGSSFGGEVAQSGWEYFRLSVTADHLSKNRAITGLTVEWGNPEEALDVFIRKDFAPVDIASLPPLNGEEAFANETFDEPDPISGATPTNPALASSPEWKAVHGWEGAKGVSSCGSFGDILGGSNLFGYGTKISKSFYVPKPHTSVRVRLDIIKIDLWDSETASFFLDGVRIWSHTWACDVIANGECSNSVSGSLECGKPDILDEKVSFDVTIPHSAPTVTLEVTTDLRSRSQNDALGRDRSWGIDNLLLSFSHDSRRAARWVDSEQDASLFPGGINASIPPYDASDECTPLNPRASARCAWSETDGGGGGRLECLGGALCAKRTLAYRLLSPGEYFVGVYGSNVTFQRARFTLRAHSGDDVLSETFPDSMAPSSSNDERWAGISKEPLALVQTYARSSAAYGVGVSIGLTGVPATFVIRAKDKYGNLRLVGGDTFNVSFEGPCGIDSRQQNLAPHPSCGQPIASPPALAVIDLADGFYYAAYTLTVGGRYAMSVRQQGVHIAGSPFAVTSAPDAEAVQAATGKLFFTSHIQFNATEPVLGYAQERMYTWFAIAVPDRESDLILSVETLVGETDVLVSNTQTHPSHSIPADVQWRSDWISLQDQENGAKQPHRIHVRYSDPLFLAGNYFVGVYARANATFSLNASVGQVAREVVLGRTYGGVVAQGGECVTDADCDAPRGFLCAPANFSFSPADGDGESGSVNASRCIQERVLRFLPPVPGLRYLVHIETMPAGEAASYNCFAGVLEPSTLALGVEGNCSECAGVQTILSSNQPYPSGVIKARHPLATADVWPSPSCWAKHTLELVNKQCGVTSEGLRGRNQAGCSDPVLGAGTVGFEGYFLTVRAAGVGTSRFTVTILSSPLSAPGSEEVFRRNDAKSPPLGDALRPSAVEGLLPREIVEGVIVDQSDPDDATYKGSAGEEEVALMANNGTSLEGIVEAGGHRFYAIKMPGVGLSGSGGGPSPAEGGPLAGGAQELRCTVTCLTGSVMLFMSATHTRPTSLSPEVAWRSDVPVLSPDVTVFPPPVTHSESGGMGSKFGGREVACPAWHVPQGREIATLRAIPTDPGYVAGPAVYYLGVYGYADVVYNASCSLSDVVAPSVTEGRKFGGFVSPGDVAFFRLIGPSPPPPPGTRISATLDSMIAPSDGTSSSDEILHLPALSLWIQAGEPSRANVTLDPCGDAGGGSVARPPCIAPPFPFLSDFPQDPFMTFAGFKGESSATANLLPGAVYYIAVALPAHLWKVGENFTMVDGFNTSVQVLEAVAANLSAPVPFTLSIS